MTPEEKAIAQVKLQQALTTRDIYRRVYKSDEAISTIAQMMDDAGYYSTNPETVNPILIAQVNRLLQSIGAVHPANVFNYAKAIVSTANDDDLCQQISALEAKEE